MFKKLILSGIFGTALILSGCESSTAPGGGGGGTVVERLTAKNWKLTAMTVTPGIDFGTGVIITDFYGQMETCEQDNRTIFNADGTITDDEGATKCDVADPQTSSGGTWLLNTDQTILTITEPGSTGDSYTIVSLTATNATLSSTQDILGDGIMRTLTISVIAQ